MLKQQAPSQPIDKIVIQGFADYLQRTIKRLEQKRANIVNIQLKHGMTTRFSEGVIEGLDAAIFILYDDIERLIRFFSTEEKENNTMTLNEYQKKALETEDYPSELKIILPTLGLTGEAGEVADKVKKVLRDNNGEFTGERTKEIAKELGDVAWYLAVLAHSIGYTLEEICKMNIDKIESRFVRGKIHGEGDNR